MMDERLLQLQGGVNQAGRNDDLHERNSFQIQQPAYFSRWNIV